MVTSATKRGRERRTELLIPAIKDETSAAATLPYGQQTENDKNSTSSGDL